MPMLRAMSLILTAAAILLVAAAWARADDHALDSRMYHDPELPSPKIVRAHPENPLPLWLVALGRPEADYQCRAALAIILGHKEGLKGLQAAIDPLLDALKQLERPERENGDLSPGHGDRGTGSDSNALVRLSVCRALIELDARQAAPQLLEQAQKGNRRVRDLIEPALARWDYRRAGPMWLARLRRMDINAGDLLLAVRGLAALREPEAASPLKDLVRSDKVDWPTRLEAARALGVIRTAGLESDVMALVSSAAALEKPQTGNEGNSQKPSAQSDSESTSASARLAAAWLLRHHQGDEAVRLLQTLARDSEPAVALVALDRLLEIDSKLVLPALSTSLASPDAGVRLRGIETLFREATVERVRLLADKLDDEHPDVRTKARQLLQDLAAGSPLRGAVIQEGARVLAGQNWRGLEQATILLVQLDHKPAAKRLVQLLSFERPEVLIAAGWGLRRLAVPESLPAAMSHFKSVHGLVQSNLKAPDPRKSLPLGAWDQQLSQLAQFMGQSRYLPAEADLRAEVPRPPRPGNPFIGEQTRAASIWALGLILEGKPETGLVRQLEQRLNDVSRPMYSGDDDKVRRMSAIALGRLQSKESLNSLRRYYLPKTPTLDPVSSACGWAIQQITGESHPPPGTMEVPAGVFKNWLRSVRPEAK
jgi:HEAT repeat protein